MNLKDWCLYCVVGLGVLALVLIVMDIIQTILPTPWAVGVTLLILALICPITWTVEGWIFGEVTFDDEEEP